MAKKPFSIRVEQNVVDRYRALATVLNVDSSKLLSELISDKEKQLNEKQLNAYKSLMNLWNEEAEEEEK